MHLAFIDPRNRRSLIRLGRSLILMTVLGLFVAVGTVVALSPTDSPEGLIVADGSDDVSAAPPHGPAADLDAADDLEELAALHAALDAEEDSTEAEVAPPSTAPAPNPAPAPNLFRGVIEPGDSLAASMAREGLGAATANRVNRLMASHFNFRRRARPGHSWRLTQDETGRVTDFRYNVSQTDSYHVFLEDDDYRVRQENAKLTPRVSRMAGVVTSSLYETVRSLGEDPALARDFADIFAWDVDFSHAVHKGDEFRVLYERLHRVDEDGNEVYVRPGLILAARYSGTVGEHTAIYFESEEGKGGYYRPDGTSVQGQFLQAPLRRARISSSYSSARRHPILNVTRPHHGIDYAAPAGDPVWAVADGKVIYRDRAGGFGNLVKVRHSNGFVSYYAHLSRFPKGLRVGDQVSQKQVIGYVGSTGLATGPHVCFRVTKDGRYVNPATLKRPQGPPISDAVTAVFHSTRDTFLAELDAGSLVASDEAL
jgi:murein DD-endopeptidase MepM/ murein hydrolase activator NlpD